MLAARLPLLRPRPPDPAAAFTSPSPLLAAFLWSASVSLFCWFVRCFFSYVPHRREITRFASFPVWLTRKHWFMAGPFTLAGTPKHAKVGEWVKGARRPDAGKCYSAVKNDILPLAAWKDLQGIVMHFFVIVKTKDRNVSTYRIDPFEGVRVYF